MTAVTLMWLLVSVGSVASVSGVPTAVVERFASEAQCLKVANAALKATRAYNANPVLVCVQAEVAR